MVSGAMSGSRAKNTCCYFYCCRSTENGDLAWTAKALPKIYCHTRNIDLSWKIICSVYHVLGKCTRGDKGVSLHQAGPGTMGHRRCLKGYDRASNQYSEKQRRTVLGFETISLVSCHMTYKPPQADSPESYDHECTLQSCHSAVVAPLSKVGLFSVLSVFSNKDKFNDWEGRGCNIFFPVLRGNGTKIAPTGNRFDQPPGQKRRIWGKLADHVGDHALSSPEGAVSMISTGTKSSYPRPP